ncbi:metallophosphoesterase [Nitritalea halalkaliphila LW7]|uniref:Metallophosphoesterase n=1 Tax=Nitritalea halalkaliphila LW7 TaxID=1189621 RepID=I5C4K3_9BACT|nr:ligase-associated DNA damage response endonuclease PdeM [Nitritalea halalkaliphila]EIM76755.1 metallophosphoesterase [Nitritalea halalkaliphila LW7]
MSPSTATYTLQLFGETLTLLPEKAIWSASHRALFLADTHFGKATHFRKAGIPVPEQVHAGDFQRLAALVEAYPVERVYFLGDLFHSDWNSAWEDFLDFISAYPSVNWHLIKGNHDILRPHQYAGSPLQVHAEGLALGQMLLRHTPLEEARTTAPDTERLILCGHVHPGFRVQGRGRQQLRMACFLRQGSQLILPAFGSFTGLHVPEISPADSVYLVSGATVLHWPMGKALR